MSEALGGSAGLFSPVELSVSAEGIADTDRLSAPDPLAVIYERTPSGFIEIGRTEVICTCPGAVAAECTCCATSRSVAT